jgi:hypothetical protein
MEQDNWRFVIAAYGAAWMAIGAYWLFVHRALRVARARYEQSQSAQARSARVAR